MNKIITILLLVFLTGCQQPVADLGAEKKQGIEEKLLNKTAKEKANIKSLEITKTKPGKFNKEGFEIEIIGDMNKIEGGVEVFAKAFKDGKPVGFSKDGTVEIERFLVYNPPILVDDPDGEIIREWADDITGELEQRKLKEDPEEAIKQVIAHNIKLVGKDGKDIVKGKVGNTTSTFYPSVDYGIYHWNTAANWNAAVTDTDGDFTLLADAANYLLINQYDPGERKIGRAGFHFDTSSLSDDDTITSATFNFYVTSNDSNSTGANGSIGIYSNACNDTTPVDADYDQFGSTLLSDLLVSSSIGTSAYATWTLTSTGLNEVKKTGLTKLGLRGGFDINNTEPGAGVYLRPVGRFVDYTGTDNDPKLVVEHGSAVIFIDESQIIVFE